MKQRNRAKCKLCGDVIESLTASDLQMCDCETIGVYGGMEVYRAIFDKPEHFIRIDDEDREIPIEYIEKPDEVIKENPGVSREEMIDMLKLHIEGFDNLPDHAKHQPASQYDVQCLAMIIYGILRN